MIHPALVAVLGKVGLPPDADPDETAFDIMAITRGITDMAGVRGDTNIASLKARTRRAVFGYLGLKEL